MQGTLISSLQLRNIVYWENKETFLLDVDVYKGWVMFIVESGTFDYEIGETKGTATFGDLVVCPPDIPFRRVVVTPLTFYYFELILEGQNGDIFIPVGKISIYNTARLAQNFTAMRKWKSFPILVRALKYKHYIQDIWLLYCDEWEENNLSDEPAGARKPEPLMHQAQLMIQQHAFRVFNLKDIAAALGISPAQLTKKFSSSFGMNPLSYLTSLRLAKAKKLLVETDLTIEHISESCGYQNGFYLHRMFVKYEHTTPSHYRKSHLI